MLDTGTEVILYKYEKRCAFKFWSTFQSASGT